MRNLNTKIITKEIKNMCIKANYFLSEDMEEAITLAYNKENNQLSKNVMSQLKDNLTIAKEEMIPICQDTGMTVVFLEIGQDILLTGEYLEDAVNEGIRQGYQEGYLRKSIVGDPLIRKNTDDNTPGIIHTKFVKGDKLKITLSPKGFGSENMSRVFMLKPADGREGVIDCILKAVKEAGPNPCPPMVIGVGIGGTFEKSALLAKEALLRPLNDTSPLQHIADLEKYLLIKINELNIGPGGLGGNTTALGVKINTYPTHIAGLPVAVNICCHANRHVSVIL